MKIRTVGDKATIVRYQCFELSNRHRAARYYVAMCHQEKKIYATVLASGKYGMVIEGQIQKISGANANRFVRKTYGAQVSVLDRHDAFVIDDVLSSTLGNYFKLVYVIGHDQDSFYLARKDYCLMRESHMKLIASIPPITNIKRGRHLPVNAHVIYDQIRGLVLPEIDDNQFHFFK